MTTAAFRRILGRYGIDPSHWPILDAVARTGIATAESLEDLRTRHDDPSFDAALADLVQRDLVVAGSLIEGGHAERDSYALTGRGALVHSRLVAKGHFVR